MKIIKYITATILTFLILGCRQEEEKVVPKKIEKDRFTVAEKIMSTREILKEKKSLF